MTAYEEREPLVKCRSYTFDYRPIAGGLGGIGLPAPPGC